MNIKPLDVTDDEFESEIIKSEIPVVVEFWSPECVHCMRMANTVQALAEEFGGIIKVAKVNVLENPVSPGKFGVSGIPAFFYIREGIVAGKTTGAMPKGRLKDELGLARIGLA